MHQLEGVHANLNDVVDQPKQWRKRERHHKQRHVAVQDQQLQIITEGIIGGQRRLNFHWVASVTFNMALAAATPLQAENTQHSDEALHMCRTTNDPHERHYGIAEATSSATMCFQIFLPP